MIGVWVLFSLIAVVWGHQFPLQEESGYGNKIAIIGAGAAGSSAAYHLQRYTSNHYDITIFEKANHTGGRSTTLAHLSPKPLLLSPDNDIDIDIDIEIGASVFIEDNLILMQAVRDFNLTLQKFDIAEKNSSIESSTGIWDARTRSWSYRSDSAKSWWWFMWRNVIQFIKLKWLVRDTVQIQFVPEFYDKQFPFESVGAVINDSLLMEAYSNTGETFFKMKKFSSEFITQFMGSISRANYAQDIELIHAMGALVTAAAAMGEVRQVKGGNFQIFDHFIAQSNASVQLNTAVTKMTKLNDGRYELVSMSNRGEMKEVFDKVIIATPILYSGIEFINTKTPQAIDNEYVDLHVFVVTTPSRIDPDYFNSDSIQPPTMITTSFEPAFISINLVDYKNNLFFYKIFTLDADFDPTRFFHHVTTIHHHEWQAYPYLFPNNNNTHDRFEIDNGLWYVNSMEAFISTMETETLAAASIAGLISIGINTTELIVPIPMPS